MRILKYIFLLLILALLALFVFVATKEGKYTISESKIIALKKATLFDYVNEYKNWEDFCQFKNDSSEMVFTYPEKTSGSGSSFRWKNGLQNGELKTIYLKKHDSIAIKMNWNDNHSDFSITFKDTVGGTKVTWNSSGIQDFRGKLFSLFYGGIENQLRTNYQKSLAKLALVLSKEINTYSISIQEVVSVRKSYYIKRKSTSKMIDFHVKLQNEMPLILEFVKDNGVATFGHSFTVFDLYKSKNNLNYAIGIPIKDKIFTTPESEFTVDSITPHQALKVILNGDYSHINEARDKGMDFLKKNNLIESAIGKYREIYIRSRTDVKNPSQWITEIYIPVIPKTVEKPIVRILPESPPVEERLE